MILSTEDHQELMKAVAEKTSAQLSLLPSVPDSNTKSSGDFDENSHEISGGLPIMVTLFCFISVIYCYVKIFTIHILIL